MDNSTVKETRQLLRRILDHLFQAHSAFGVDHETVGFVDVIHHPTNQIPDLNYVTPRRNTAWVSGKFVQQGLDRLRALDRLPRVEYIEGLYPPQFAKALSDLGLESGTRNADHGVLAGGCQQESAAHVVPGGIRLEIVTDQRGIEQWRAVWQSDGYDVLTLGVEPLAVGRDDGCAAARSGHRHPHAARRRRRSAWCGSAYSR